jgi:hypothetical protein
MFTLDQVVPWGRSYAEYRRMFALADDELSAKRVLGCADGPASFNAEAAARGVRVVSCDPLYRLGEAQIRERIVATSGEVLEQTRRNAHEFLWREIPSIEALGALRKQAMHAFLDDFGSPARAGRYVAAALPALPFANDAFDLAVCSHFLFLYSTQMSEGFHTGAVDELCRVAADVRIFPLVALGATPSPHVAAVAARAAARGCVVSIETVPYEFQRGANQMLRLVRSRAGQA